MPKRVADVLVDSLVSQGVKRVYGVVGDSLNGIVNAIGLDLARSNGSAYAMRKLPPSPLEPRHT